MGLKFYSSFMRSTSKEKLFTLRKAVVQEALEEGIKPTARRYSMSKNTVRLWLRRFREEGNDGLLDRRSGPNHIPHKTSKKLEGEVIKIRTLAPCYGAKRMKDFFDLKPSIGAIQRIIKDYGLVRKKRRKHKKKNDLRAIKSRYRAFEKVQMDIKYLTDIPPYWEAMMKLTLPRFQYTIRDVKNDLRAIKSRYRAFEKVQTDNGVEFSGTTRKVENNHFRQAVKALGAEHIYIPPGHCNANADVESIHATIETEFYELTNFISREDFLQKAESYRQFYNLERPNYSKGGKSPWLIAQQDHPDTDFATHMQFTNVIDLDRVFKYQLGVNLYLFFPRGLEKMSCTKKSHSLLRI